MRINARIATSGNQGVSRFPTISCDADDCMTDRGQLDEAKARKALSSEELITWSNKDNKYVMAFAIEYLQQLRNVVEWMNKRPEINVKYDVAKSKVEKRCARNMKNGRFCYARTEITMPADHIVVKIGWSNPQGLFGEGAEVIPKDFALLCTNIVLCISDEIRKRGGVPIEIVEGENCEGYIEKARAINRENDRELEVRRLKEKREVCENRKGEYCSPSCPGCELYKKGGKCCRVEELRIAGERMEIWP